ncbi:cupin domain-containing protein [Cellulomonas marina]|uniref:Cupin domain-containing protein n=1 Tax=Cellulomonas marina TaxID=988821 RepID=A0A1I0V0V0_9CELL|nr:cupin domain-containing protein [Cellulomonas marina]GIG29916.1 hypothetical protein Cma02nite_25160 [Cellulomonas marina]SFA69166.1 Cupin domain-containing protein [Cellulomonas marina]
MKQHHLDDMVRGWFVGDFEPTALRTGEFEVAVQRYAAGDVEPVHRHDLADEITVVVSGEVEMCGRRWSAGDIVTVEKGEATGFRALTDAVTVAVKRPSVIGDKHLVEPTGAGQDR